MFNNIIETIKTPVSTIVTKSQEETLKKGIIKALIISVIMSLLAILTRFIVIVKSVDKNSFWVEKTNQELWELRWEKVKNAKLFSSFFNEIILFIAIIAIIAFVIFIIAKILKNEKEYTTTLSITNNIMCISIAGNICGMLLSLIYAPIGIFVNLLFLIYGGLTLVYSVREILDMSNTDSIVLISTLTIIVTMIIVTFILTKMYDIDLKDMTTLTNLVSGASSDSISDYSSFFDD